MTYSSGYAILLVWEYRMFNVQKLIDKSIETNYQFKGDLRDNEKFHVSDSGTCYRKRFYKRLGIVPTGKIDTKSLRKMVAGDAGHEKIQWLLNRYGNLFASEGELETEHIKGHFDGVVKNGKEKSLLEIKTIEKWSMGYIKKDGPKNEHVLQLFTYWWLLRQDYLNLDQAVLSYIKREDFETHDFYYKWNKKLVTKVLKEWKPLVAYWKKKKLPPCTCDEDYGGNGVKYCRYKTKSGKRCCSKALFTNYLKREEKENGTKEKTD